MMLHCYICRVLHKEMNLPTGALSQNKLFCHPVSWTGKSQGLNSYFKSLCVHISCMHYEYGSVLSDCKSVAHLQK